MDISILIDKLDELEIYSKYLSLLESNKLLNIHLPQNSFFSILVNNIQKISSVPVIILTSSTEQAEKYFDDINILSDRGQAKIFHKFKSPDLMIEEIGNIESFDALRKGKEYFYIFDHESISQKISIKQELVDESIGFKIGQEYNFSNISTKLYKFQYEKKDFVFEPGDFAIRGGILDVFPFIAKHPFRIEFLGDSIESIREFDESTQRSISNIESVSITPNFFSQNDNDNSVSILSFIKDDSIIIIDGAEALDKYFSESVQDSTIQKNEFWNIIDKYKVIKNHLFSYGNIEDSIQINNHPNYNSSIKILYQDLQNYCNDGFEIFILCDGEKRLDILKSLLEDFENNENIEKRVGFFPSGGESELKDENKINFILQSLHNGFICQLGKIAVLTEHEIFGRFKKRIYSQKKKIKGFSTKDLDSIHHGEYIVHVDYGVGIFDKLQRIRVGDSEQECVRLKYLDGDSLFVNLNYINRIRKYNATEGVIPRINKLGSPDWERLKARTKKRIKDIARDLISLYAKRKASDGFAFNTDTIWQKELEASFIYEDTPDQSNASEAVKKDMESISPMDRLICGDVGYGKTEVAVRAAFKAVMDGKQVAILVPTTILAEQHYKTFSSRLKNYPVSIASISRFRTQKEQKEILEKLQSKQIDILIGTHRLLSKDVTFKDIGLLIIDEEHRFGVTAKEKLRKIKVNIDTLTLTATPIPRTLNFSLLGARDLSIIETPPKNRLPIDTMIIKFDEDQIRNAVLKEISRGGQIYFVNDKVNNIDNILAHLIKILPEVRFGIAHGQMPTTHLEKAMLAFLEKKFDVLVCTKIVESGLDIPNVNTIIVNRADHFGLAELYQLRGRVGRSNIQAYAYFIIPGFDILSQKAVRRLQAIEEFTELSSGFKLAMRDMEIRGVGNFLGAEQSGFVESMGFDLYCKILDEAVEELKNDEFKNIFDINKLSAKKKLDVLVEIDKDAYLPEDFISDNSERFNYYQKLYDSESELDVYKIREEIIDKFGKFGEESENLVKMVTLRIYLSDLKVSKLNLKNNRIILFFKKEYFSDDKSFAIFNTIIDSMQKNKYLKYYVKDVKEDVTLNITINLENIDYLDWSLEFFKVLKS